MTKTCPASMTQRIFADSDHHTLDCMVEPGTDLEGSFKAWCNDEQEMLTVNGWLFDPIEIQKAAQ